MPYYRQVGEVPRKRHTQFRQPDGGLYAEELMGVEGFSSDASLLYHRAPADGDRVQRGLRRADASPVGPTTRSSRGTSRRTSSTARPRPPTRCSAGSTCWPTTTYASPTSSPTSRRRSTATRSATSASTSRAARRVVETVFGALTVGAGDYVVIPTSTTHRWVPDGGEPLRAARRPRRPATSAPPQRYLSSKGQFLEHAPYCERDLRGPAEPLHRRGRGRRGARAAPRAGQRDGVDALRLRAPPVRRRRLGRLPLPLRVLHPRLRADHRPAAPAAAGAPDVRGPELRRLLVRAAAVRLPPGRHPGAVQPRQRRLRRDDLLHRRRLHVAQGRGHRAGLDLAAPVRLHPRPAARARSRRRSARRPPTSWRSWSTRSARWTCSTRRWPARTRRTPGPGPAARIDPEADSTTG